MKNQIKTILLLGLLSVLLIALGAFVGKGFMYFAVIAAVAMNFAAYFWSDKIVLRMSSAREVSPEEAPALHNMVEELAFAARVPKPRVYVIPQDQPNAFATGRNPEHGAVAVTQGILRLLSERELRGVIAHEIAHIANRDILIASVAAMVAAAISWIGNALQFAAIFGGGGTHDEDRGSAAGGLVAAIVAPVAAMLLQMSISRSREYLADERGARFCGDPLALADALEKLHIGSARIAMDSSPATASLFIVNPFGGMGRSLMNLFSTHPPMEKRIERLYAMAGVLPPARFKTRRAVQQFS